MSRAEGSRWPFLALSAAHLCGCLHYFPPREIFSGEPLFTSDYVVHFLEAARMGGSLRQGSFLGYSTVWMAGFPDGFNSMIKNKPFCLALALTPAELQPLAFNLLVLLALFAFPPLIYAAARGFGYDRHLAAVSMALSLFAFYGSGLFRVFWRGGSVLFIVASAAALWVIALFWRRWTEPEGSAVAPALGLSILLWIHPAAAVIVVFGAGAAYLLTFGSRKLRLGELALVAIVAIGTNLPWLWPFVAQAGLRSSLYYPIYQGGAENLLFDLVRAPLHLGSGPREETAVVTPLVVGMIGASRALRDRRLVRLFAATGILLALVAYGGGQLRATATLQPYRFTIPLAGLAAIGAAPLFELARRGPSRRTATILSLILLSVLGDRIRVARRAGDYLGAGLGTVERWALEHLSAAAAPRAEINEGRVLLEGDWLSEPVPGRPRSRWISYSFVGFERYLRAEFIGAEATGVGLPQSYASFWRGRLFGRRLQEYDREAFLRVADLYDLRWVVTARPESRARMEGFAPAVSLVEANGPVGIFRIERQPQRLFAGRGDARSDGRNIRAELSDGGPAVLKYHWIPSLRADPQAELEPARIDPASPAAFVELRAEHPGAYSIGARMGW